MLFTYSQFSLDEDWIRRELDLAGQIIIACNDRGIDLESMLDYYKERSAVERGFKSIMDKIFHVSEVF